jgi:Methyltransferase domain
MLSAGVILRRAANLAGFDLIRRNYYSPLPRLDELAPETYERRSPWSGIAWDEAQHEACLRDLVPYLEEFTPPEGFSWGNGMYEPIESEILHAMVRRRKPNRIVEIGSGFTSLIIAAACRLNASEGRPPHYASFDPFPRDFVRSGIEGMDSFEAMGATEVPEAVFETLTDGDILFIDTTHTVKIGGDVNRLMLEVLPKLRPGVFIHVHDIFLPYEYPRGFFESQCFWQEQYLLQALLTENQNFEIVLPVSAITRERPDLISALMPWHEAPPGPGAFWIRRTDG